MEDAKFNKILLACVILTPIIMGIVYYLKYLKWKEDQSKIAFPPFPSKCPDYWEVQDENVCRNTHAIGLCKTGGDRDMDFTDELFTGRKGDYYKCAWSKQCQVPWEGIDNLC